MKFTTVLIGLVAMAASLPATTVYFGGGGGALGMNTASYGLVTATGYLSNGVKAELYGKGAANGTGTEDGLGLVADPTKDGEIFVGTDFIQLDIQSLSGTIQISMGSTAGDTWAVYGSNTAGSLGAISLAAGGNDDSVEVTVTNAKSYKYLDVVATKNNVLLQDLIYTSAATPTPEPGTLGIVGLGGVLIGLLRRKRNRN
jgi:hypothetical protein